METEGSAQHPETAPARAARLVADGEAAFARGEWPAAEAAYRAASDAFGALGLDGPQAGALHQLGLIRQYQDDYAGAEAALQESRRLAEQAGDQAALAGTLHQLGRSRLQQGDYAGADSYYAESLVLKTVLSDRAAMASTLHQMGMLRRLQGNLGEAAEFYGLALAINQRLENWAGAGGTLVELARLRLQEGDLIPALANAWQALSIFHGSSRPEAAAAAGTILAVRRQMDPAAFAGAAGRAGITREVIAQIEEATTQL